MDTTTRLAAACHVSPLTVLVRGLVEWAFPDALLEDLFQRHAPHQDSRMLAIPALVEVLIQVVAGAHRSVFAADQADQARDTPTWNGSFQALYPKRGRLDPAFPSARTRPSALRLEPLRRAAGRTTFQGWSGYRVRLLDGTDLDGTEPRLGVLRRTRAAGRPGRRVVCYDAGLERATQTLVSEDAYTSERTLVVERLPTVEPQDVLVGDRHCGFPAFRFGVAKRRGRFVVRQHAKTRVPPLKQAQRVGRTPTGDTVWEQPVVGEDPVTGQRLKCRQILIRLTKPTRHGETERRRLTNLRARVGGLRIAALYRHRGTLEGHFALVKDIRQGAIPSLGQPRAALFALSVAWVVGKALGGIKAALAEAPGPEAAATVSNDYLADEVAANPRAVNALVAEATWSEVAAHESETPWRWCVGLAKPVRLRAFRKQPRGPKRPPPKRTGGGGRPHHSTYRLLQEAKALG